MNVILNETQNNREYGVLTAKDNDSVEYLLIAPKRELTKSRNNSITEFNINQATYIDVEAAIKFEHKSQ